jgi:hypothetical protein
VVCLMRSVLLRAPLGWRFRMRHHFAGQRNQYGVCKGYTPLMNRGYYDTGPSRDILGMYMEKRSGFGNICGITFDGKLSQVYPQLY